MKTVLKTIALSMILVLSSCKKETKTQEPTEKVIEMTTPFGTMYLWLFKETPLHRANFLKLAEEGYYNNTTFHRIIPNFMIQGGDPNSKDADPNNDGSGGPGYTIPAEIKANITHDKGRLAAARTNNPEKASSGCQFYIVADKNGANHLNGEYTVYGEVFSGLNIIDSIVKQKRNAKDRPFTDIKMQVKVIEKSLSELKSTYNYTPTF